MMAPESDKHILVFGSGSTFSTDLNDAYTSLGLNVKVSTLESIQSGLKQPRYPDLVILDLEKQDSNLLYIYQCVRRWYDGPVLVLADPGLESDCLKLVEAGANDCLTKPIPRFFLLAHIQALLWYAADEGPPTIGSAELPVQKLKDFRVITLGDIEINASRRTVNVGGKDIDLTSAEFELLWLLAQRAGEVVSRDTICDKLRGIEYDGLNGSVDLRVFRLRRKLGDDGRYPHIIKSVRGEGYILVSD